MIKPGSTMVSSSPAREKLPVHGLARFIGGSGGRSRSRGRAAARSSPMFVSRSRSAGRPSAPPPVSSVAGDGEPSSPKVTCIGQVRMRNKRAKKQGNRTTATATTPVGWPCRCLQKALTCGLFPAAKKRKSGGRRSLWRRWTDSGAGDQPDPEVKIPPLPEFIVTRRESVLADCRSSGEVSTEIAPAPTVPKNALMLMRCRSAPHNRASALAVPTCPLSTPTTDVVAEVAAEVDDDDDVDGMRSESQRPLVLPRSKSETTARGPPSMASYCFWTTNAGGRRLNDGPQSIISH